MKFGVYLNQMFHRPGQPVFHEIVAQAQLMEEWGYDLIGFGERHVHPPGMHEILTTMSAMATVTRRLGLCSAGFILPLYDPVFLAEAAANLDVLSGGRLLFGVVQGYRPEELAMFNVRPAERPGRTEEALAIIKRLWAGETVTYQGRYYRTTGAFLSPLPYQKPRPPIWIGAHAEEAIRRAARLADGWIASYNASVDELAHKIGVFREAAQEHGTRGEIVLMRDGFVAESYAEARRVFEEPILNLYRSYADWKRDSPDAYKYANLTFSAFEHRLVFGDPEACRRAVQQYAAMGVETLILRFQPPGLRHEDVLRCLRLFAEEVIAPLRAATTAPS